MVLKNLSRVSLLLILLCMSLVGCDVLPSTSTTNTPAPTNGQVGAPLLNNWKQAAPGVEIRYEHWKSTEDDQDTVAIVRMDLERIHISIGYNAEKPADMGTWMKKTGALVMINGGYFVKSNQPAGLLVSDGQYVGTSYDGFGGMLSVDTQGLIRLRSLKEQPYNPNVEQLQQATQSSPMFMIKGKRGDFQGNSVSQRRSVIATDTKGHLLLIVSPNQAFTLDEMADQLMNSDLSIRTALNLDGGASTGLYVNSQSEPVTIDSFTTLPIVIIIK